MQDAGVVTGARFRFLGPITAVAIAAWAVGAVTGLGALAIYSTKGSSNAVAPEAWPVGSGIERTEGRTGLVLFLHPRCPCSSATMSELSRVLARAGGEREVIVAMYRPGSEGAEWGRGPLRARAEAIPGVRMFDDIDGVEALRFGAVCSGHAVAYDADGAITFQGGITASRGHEGDNLGADSLVAVLRGEAPAAVRTPTFGCEIVSSDADSVSASSHAPSVRLAEPRLTPPPHAGEEGRGEAVKSNPSEAGVACPLCDAGGGG